MAKAADIEVPGNMKNLYIVDSDYETSVPIHAEVGQSLQDYINQYIQIMKDVTGENGIIGGLSAERMEDFCFLTEQLLGRKIGDAHGAFTTRLSNYISEIDTYDDVLY